MEFNRGQSGYDAGKISTQLKDPANKPSQSIYKPGEIKTETKQNPQGNLQQNAMRRQEDEYDQSKYPIHHDLQMFINILQKLFSSNADLALNQKLSDVSDADLRMLPFKMIRVSMKYVFALKMCILFFLSLVILHHINNEFPIFLAYSLTTVAICISIFWAAHILYKAKEFVIGNKTSRYFNGLMAGWKIFETAYIVFTALSILYLNYLFTTKETMLQYIQNASTWRLPIGKFLASKAEIILGTLEHTSFFIIASFISYFLVVIFTKHKAKEQNIINRKNIDLETKREEVADIILNQGYDHK